MTSTDLVRPTSGFDVAVIAPLADLAERICRTEFVPTSLRSKPEATLAAMLTGEELGIKPMTALQKIHVIEGRPGLAAELMRALILQHGHDIWVEEKSNTRVTVAGRRKGTDRVSKVTWTADDVKKAGLDGRPNHKRYPRAMLTARATAELARDIFPDLIGGLYAVEELSDGFGFGEGDVIDIDPETLEANGNAEAKTTHTRSAGKRAPAKPARPKADTPAKSATADRQRPPAPPLPAPQSSGGVVTPSTAGADTGSSPATVAPPELSEPSLDDPFPEPTPEEEAEAQQAAEAKVFETFAGAKEVGEVEETGELADDATVARLRAKRDQLDDEQRQELLREWQGANLRSIKEGATGRLLYSQAPLAEALLDEAIANQTDVYDRRRKHILASLQEIGYRTDEQRHELIGLATDNQTSSSKALLGRQVRAIKDMIEAVRSEQSGADR
jgi:hypothetical protein